MTGIKDVAKKAGVSISTVSHVLNGTKFVSEDLKIRVMASVHDLKYEVDPTARTMKSKQTKTIGVISADICGLFYPYIVKAIYEIANKRGYQVMICDSNGEYGQTNALEKEINSFKQLISNKVDGIIFASVASADMASGYFSKIIKMANARKYIPLVSVEQDFSEYGIDSIYLDGVMGSKMATNHLIECGCKKIVHVTGPEYMNIAKVRIDGYRQAMAEAGLEVHDRMIAAGNYTHQSGYEAIKKLLQDVPDLDGVFSGNDQMAVGIFKAFTERKIKVPEDVKVIGYDDVFVSGILHPSLSTIHVNKRSLGQEAAKVLFERIDQGETIGLPHAIPMQSRLIVRQSSNPKEAVEDWQENDW